MEKIRQIAITIRWTARIFGGINLLFLLFMFGANIMTAISSPSEVRGNNFNSTTEMITFLFFPVSTIVGLFIAMKWDGLGGFIIIGGIVSFHFMRPDLLLDPMIDGLAAPGLLFFTSWLLSLGGNRKETNNNT